MWIVVCIGDQTTKIVHNIDFVLRLMQVLFTALGANYRMGDIKVQFSKAISRWLDRSIFSCQFQVSKWHCISELSVYISNLVSFSCCFFVLVTNLNGIDLIGSSSTSTFSVLPPALKKNLRFILHYYALHLSRFILHITMTFWNSSCPDLLWIEKELKEWTRLFSFAVSVCKLLQS